MTGTGSTLFRLSARMKAIAKYINKRAVPEFSCQRKLLPPKTSGASMPGRAGLQHPESSSASELHDAIPSLPESAWVEVIQQMERTYAELVSSQVDLETSNQELEAANSFISGILNAMTDMLVVCDPQGRIRQTNPAAQKMLGIRENELIGAPIHKIFHNASAESMAPFLELARKGKLVDYEQQLRGKHGRIPLSINAALHYDHRNRVQNIVIVGRSVSELKRANDELNRSLAELKVTQENLVNSEKMASLGRLVAGVAHELNNPISFVYGNTHVLAKYVSRFQRYLEAIEQLPESAQAELQPLKEELRIDRMVKDFPSLMQGSMEGIERVRDIVDELRHFSSGQQSEQSRFDLIQVLNTAIRWVTRDTPVRLEQRLPATLAVTGHSGRIHQVLMNLVQNAIDVMSGLPEPVLHLEAGQSGSHAWLTVRDNGPGIPNEILDRIFEPFYTTKPVGQGTGLGLSLSYSFAMEHGGDLTAANHPDGGAIFTLELPLA